MISKIVLASKNPHKFKEVQQILQPLGIEVLSARDFSHLEDVEEDADTLEGNALKKARYVAKETDLPALSDDTGLEVDALNGAPGVYSARYAGENASYEDNVGKLLDEMEGVSDRAAKFRTVMAMVSDKSEYTFEGVCEGIITTKPKGDKGFGYDPVFQPEGYNQTFAELDSSIKNEISHRGKAVQKFIEFLKK